MWAAIFLYKHNEKRELVIRTFAFGGVMVLPFMLYRKLWDYFPSLSLDNLISGYSSEPIQIFSFSLSISLAAAILFASLGCIEEFLKHKVASSISHHEINSIDDAIEFSIIAALGFSFAENTFYFIEVWKTMGPSMLYKVVVFRSLFSTFAHILFSSIYGYHFGLAVLASPILENPKDHSFYKRIAFWVHSIFHVRTNVVFKDFQLVFGLVIASFFHGLYNILLEMKNTIFLVPFLVFGFIYIMKLISDERNQKALLKEVKL
jgi:RsiW-degrading membrane proteinase PrsW (M82 family)